jgi:small-conductance mechanosensitive channel
VEAQAAAAQYPVRLSIDYPDRDLNRLTTFFRIFVAIPILIVLAAVSGGGWGAGWDKGKDYIEFGAAAGGILFFAPLLMILFRQKYPRWWFDWNLNLFRFQNRVFAYVALTNDRYPSTDEEQAVHIQIDYPDVRSDLNRWLPLVKWLLAIPHWIVLVLLGIAAFFAVIFAWFVILFTGRYPRGLFDFVEGVFRWGARVEGYALLLVTDRYPPFSLQP